MQALRSPTRIWQVEYEMIYTCAFTYNILNTPQLKQEADLQVEQHKVEQEIATYQQNEKRLKELAVEQESASDDLDNFMNTLSEDVTKVDKTEIKKLRVRREFYVIFEMVLSNPLYIQQLEEQRIKTEQQKLQRLIKIAKPTALPFLASSTSAEGAAKSQEGNPVKKQLPMIGKRNQFSKFKVIKAVPSTQPKVKVNAFESEGEEVEEEEEEEEKIAEKHEEPKPDAVAKPSTNKHTTEIEPTVAPEGDKNNSIGETDAINKSNVKTADGESPDGETADGETPEDTSSVKGSTPPQTTEQTTEEEEDEATAQKKRRQRARQRANKQQRQDVDMDMNELAEHEEEEKYAKWVPPTNQSGDGFTHLNDKFGY